MPSIFGISISGLQTSQAALNTAAHNISNANVEGYSRQRVSQETRNPEFLGGNYFGSGVEVGRVVRIFNQTQQIELQAATSNFNQLDTYLAEAGRVDGLLADSDNGLNQAMQSFFSSLQGVVNDPASVSARQVMLGQANSLVARFGSIQGQLETQTSQINTSIESIAKEISSLGQSIASLNNQISGSAGGPPPDLLDQRDAAITRLSELVAVQTTEQSDGSLNVFIGSGQSLVVGSISNSLVAGVDDQNPRRRTLNLTAGTSSIDITNNLNGGKLGGLLNVIDDIIEPAMNSLGRVALGLADTMNQQSQLGMDLNYELGSNLFTDINDPSITASRVLADKSNAGTASISLTVDDPSLLTDSNYRLFVQGGNYQLIDQTTNTSVASFAPPATVPASISIPQLGITFDFNSGAAVDGDSFEIQPSRNFARDFSVAITTAEQIAAASPIRGEVGIGNIGSGTIEGLRVSDTSTSQFTGVANNLNPPIRIEFDTPPGTPGEFSIYDISGATPVLLAGGIAGYVPNQQNDMLALAGAPFDSYGYEISLAGDPQAGDSFDINYNINGDGSNENIALMGDIQQRTILDNGNSTLQQSFGRVIGRVGVNTQSAQINRDAAEGILFQTKERRDSLSGVNLDEEAANLLKYQQAYEASAQVISVARSLFQTVLDSVR